MKKLSGFTLLELVLAMGLTVLLLATLSAGMYPVINDWQRKTSVLDDTLDKTLAVLQIERALIAAFPHSYIDRDKLERFIYFKGTETSLSWVSTVSPQRQTGLTAWLLDSDQKKGLQLSLTPAYSDDPEQRLTDISPATIINNYTAQFSYLLQESDKEKRWLNEWVGVEMQSLPIAVHIILTPLNNERDQVMEILAPIKVYAHEDIQANLSIYQ